MTMIMILPYDRIFKGNNGCSAPFAGSFGAPPQRLRTTAFLVPVESIWP